VAKPADIPEDAFHPVAQDFDPPNLNSGTAPGFVVGPEVLRLPAPPPPMPPRSFGEPPLIVVRIAPKPAPKPAPKAVAKPRVISVMPSVADARAYALSRIGSVQFACLDRLFTRESNWNPHAYNSSSGAYGIPQAVPGDKMATFGADWRDNPITQVKWGLSYIAGRYGTACRAWSHAQTYGWY
jgi:hypothetical protein